MALGASRKLKVTKKIGFACKWIDTPAQVNGIKPNDDAKKYNTGSTTVSWLNRQSQSVAEEKLWDLVKGNIEAVRKLVERVGTLDENLRMVRLGSDILPVYTQRDWQFFYRLPDVRAYCERAFRAVGDLARKNSVRLSFHPGQFTVLASESDDIVNRSIEEFEYHVDMARWMGYGKSFQDFKINVHISGKRGPAGIIDVLPRLSPEARNCITIENDENAWGIESSLELQKHCALVLDVHHHWVRTGDYIRPTDDRVLRVIDSWRGVRPVAHYSVSREEWLPGHCDKTLPDYAQLLAAGHKKQKLRAHSNFYWNSAVNEWALSFLATHDIMCESKAKNLASFALAKQAKELDLL
jgi:UV DNA damage repair endonuclease